MFLKEQEIVGVSTNTQNKITLANRAKFTRLNVEKLKGVLSYFSYLRANGEISDKAFESLVRHACSIFIENEVGGIVQEALERKLIEFLSSKFSSSLNRIPRNSPPSADAPAQTIESQWCSLIHPHIK